MSVIGHSPLAGASGAAGAAGDPVYVDDVFSTFLYEGNSSTNVINNGIDLSGEGGLVWLKNRSTGNTYHYLCDTERGTERYLYTNGTGAEYYYANNGVTSFNSNGFTVKGTSDWFGLSGEKICSWTFRKQSKFFDVVTYNGTGSAQNISHSLGSVPGMIMIHCRDGTHDWEVYHRATGATKSLHLNKIDAQTTDSTVWNNTTPTSSVFTVGTSSNVNQNGHGYVAYVFAHDEQSFGTDSGESVIKCGGYTGDGTWGNAEGNLQNLGFEPQWLMIKNASRSSDPHTGWFLFDNMRGVAYGKGTTSPNGYDQYLHANKADAESTDAIVNFTSVGFSLNNSGYNLNKSGDTYIYMAIRRPHKPPTAAAEVFDVQSRTTTNPNLFSTPLLYVDAAWNKITSGTGDWLSTSRLQGSSKYLKLNSTGSEGSAPSEQIEYDNNYKINPWRWADNATESNYLFRRAPGFFDVVAYMGTGSAASVAHNLEATPQLLIIKKRSAADSWVVYTTVIDSSMDYMYLNSTAAKGNSSSGLPTSTVFNLSAGTQVNGSGIAYISYLFATLDGISKVGTYSGTGSNINVDCGFTAGARFILIKRTDSAGDWYVWDTVRGIVSGNDPYLLLNSNAAQVTNTDYIDPLNAGFTVTSSAPAALNTSGGTYLFFAIA